MENEKSLDFKGFGKHSPKANKKKRKKQRRKITRIVEHVDQVTAQKKSVPQALEKFQKLVDEGESAKLVAYFQQYGISPEITLLNLDILIAEELTDLSQGNA